MGIFQKVLDKINRKGTDGQSPDSASSAEGETQKQADAAKAASGIEQEVLAVILGKLKELTEDVDTKIMQVDNRVSAIEQRLESNDELNHLKEDMQNIHKTLDEFTAVYEMISNQYNPFVDKGGGKAKPGKAAGEDSGEGDGIKVEDALDAGPADSGDAHEDIVVEDAISKEAEDITIKKDDLGQGASPKLDIKNDKNAQEIISLVESETHGAKEINEAVHDMATISDSMKAEIVDSIISDKKASGSKKLTKTVAEGKQFIIQGLKPISSLLDLVTSLNSDPSLFKEHVGPRKDHFTHWIEDSLKMKALAKKLNGIKDRDKYLVTILSEV